MNTFYKDKRILSIGARKKILTRFSIALKKEGFKAFWSDQHDEVDEVLKAHGNIPLDIITFGRGVSGKNKALFQQKFKTQNPAIAFVNGLAPITNLLVDQIKLACKPDSHEQIDIHIKPAELEITLKESGRLRIKHYRLNWLFQSNEKVIFEQSVGTETLKVPFKKRSGSNFMVLEKDGFVTDIEVIS